MKPFHVCGAPTLEHIQAWFGPFFRELADQGFVLCQYEPLPRNLILSTSGWQVAFARYEATPRTELAWPSSPSPAHLLE